MHPLRHAATISCAGHSPEKKLFCEVLDKAFEAGEFKPFETLSHLEPRLACETGTTAGASAERAALLSHGLTRRDIQLLWAGRGGYGTTALWSYLVSNLPPVLPQTHFVGYSDNSFIGNLLSLFFEDIVYIHYRNAFDRDLWKTGLAPDLPLFKDLLKDPSQWKTTLPLFPLHLPSHPEVRGTLLPINLSLAESLCSVPDLPLGNNCVWFLEDCNEDTYCLLRKLDSLINRGAFSHATAVVLGEFVHARTVASPHTLGRWIHQKTRLPIFLTNRFGHGYWNVPLVAGSEVCLLENPGAGWQAHLTGLKKSQDAFSLPRDGLKKGQKLHFMGIGGTGMAAVAGLAHQAGYPLSGSDGGALYPPMDAVVASLPIAFHEGYHVPFMESQKPHAAIVANAISRPTSTRPGNEELEWVLEHGTPFYSFPSFLNRAFLKDSTNIVVAGTHGKTTTTSYIAHVLNQMGVNPSYLIGGTPIGFSNGYCFRTGGPWVLEGDEYDTAFFDKGPKFLHYNPKIAIVGNIEFDHADIYPNVESIIAEFSRLVEIVIKNRGVVVANTDCPRVCQLLNTYPEAATLSYGQNPHPKRVWQMNTPSFDGNGYKMSFQVGSNPKENLHFYSHLNGLHNAYNTAAVLTSVLAFRALTAEMGPQELHSWCAQHQEHIFQSTKVALETFRGVKRRFERLGEAAGVEVFDDFAHHPTAVQTTIRAFLDYISQRRPRGAHLRVCFDPRNATMRRSTLQKELAESFQGATTVYLGKPHVDERIPAHQRFSAHWVAQNSSAPTLTFDDNHILLQTLARDAKAGDVVVFMSSGAFDGLPSAFLDLITLQG